MSPTNHLSDAIAAASLVLAVLAALYGLWLGKVEAALAITPKDDVDDREPQRKQARSALLNKALPLLGATIASAVVLAPRTLAILCEVYFHHLIWAFDDVKALFVITFILLAVLATALIIQTVALVSKLRELT